MIGLIPAFEALSTAVSAVDGLARSVTTSSVGQKAGPAAGADFGSILSQVANEAIDSVKAGEKAAISGIQGKASVQQVVDAVMSAERSLQTAIAIRDKITGAYQDISRMAI